MRDRYQDRPLQKYGTYKVPKRHTQTRSAWLSRRGRSWNTGEVLVILLSRSQHATRKHCTYCA